VSWVGPYRYKCLLVLQLDIIQGARKYSKSDMRASAGRILEEGWTVYKASKEHKVSYTKRGPGFNGSILMLADAGKAA
jgi:hypothetical protein